MKSVCIICFVLFIFCISCSAVKTATSTSSVETLATQVVGTPLYTSLTSVPTETPELLPSPTPTCEPLPSELTPGETLLARPNKTVTDTLAALMLQTFLKKFPKIYEIPAVGVIDDLFGIEIVDGSIDSNGGATTVIPNVDKTLGVFFSYDDRPLVEDFTYDQWYESFTSKKMLIKDFETGEKYWVKWKDHMPWRPIEIEGWVTRDIFVFSQFGNPWHGFLVAIDARTKKVLVTLQLEYWCQ